MERVTYTIETRKGSRKQKNLEKSHQVVTT